MQCECVSFFLNAFFLTSKHLLPAASVDKLPLQAAAAAMFDWPPRSVTALAAGQTHTVPKLQTDP